MMKRRLRVVPAGVLGAASAFWMPLALVLAFSALWPVAALRAQDQPTVTVMATKPVAETANDTPGIFTLSIPAAQTTDFKVTYALKGTAVNGQDYSTLSGTKKIKAGKTSVAIKVIPSSSFMQGSATVKLIVKPGTGYTVGTPKKATVVIEPVIVLP